MNARAREGVGEEEEEEERSKAKDLRRGKGQRGSAQKPARLLSKSEKPACRSGEARRGPTQKTGGIRETAGGDCKNSHKTVTKT
jgi:hypothetical protein